MNHNEVTRDLFDVCSIDATVSTGARDRLAQHIQEQDATIAMLADALKELYDWKVETGRPMFFVRQACYRALRLAGRLP